MGQYVLVRTYSAGVHIGTLMEHKGKEIVLLNAKRIWRWRGANTLSEVSQNGIDKEFTRISEMVPSIFLSEAIEIIPCSEKAIASFESRWEK